MNPSGKKSKTDKWGTPVDFYEKLNIEFNFNFDPCPADWKQGDIDGLEIEWGDCTFCNPPYSKTSKWIEKAHAEWKKGKTVVMLINTVTDTKAFHEFVYNQAELRFIKGRLKFQNLLDLNKKPGPNPKSSMLVIFKKK